MLIHFQRELIEAIKHEEKIVLNETTVLRLEEMDLITNNFVKVKIRIEGEVVEHEEEVP